jgi:replicative DNA helicase
MIDLEAMGSQEMIVGSFVKDGATIANVEAMNTIPPEAFSNLFIRDAFVACRNLADKAEDIDSTLVDDLMTRANTKSGGQQHDNQFGRINELWHNSLKGSSIAAHVKKLVRCYQLRMTQQALLEINDSINNGEDINEVVETVESVISSLRLDGTSYQTQHIRDLVEGYADNLEARGGEIGIRTGFEDCDKLLGKVAPGNLIVVSARPGQGKTEFACAWAVNAAVHQKRNVLIFSLEMQNTEIMDRFVALDANMPVSALDNEEALSKRGDGGWALVAAALSKFHDVNISMHDEPSVTLSKMRQVIKDTERKLGKVDLVMIDYLQLMKDPRAKSRVEEVSNISMGLKTMAKDFKMPIVALAQLNRECEKHDREPRPSDIAESGQIEKDSDKIIFLHCPNKDQPNEPNFQLSKVIFAKVRQGATGAACLEFSGGHFKNCNEKFKDDHDIKQEKQSSEQSSFVGKSYKR